MNDIALIQVEMRIEFSRFIVPACLYSGLFDEKSKAEIIDINWRSTTDCKLYSSISHQICIFLLIILILILYPISVSIN